MRISFLFLLLFLVFNSIIAEGTRETAPNAQILVDGNVTNDIAALLINHSNYNTFASYLNQDTNSRLYIRIQDPLTECIYLGLSYGHPNSNGSNPPETEYEFRIVDPAGNIVYGPMIVTQVNANIQNWQQANTGPSQIYGTDGYDAIEISSAELSSSGWNQAGDYYIEFLNRDGSNEFLIDYWDITVSDCESANPSDKRGRVWSYNWAFFAINDFGFPNRPFNGSVYVCAPDPDDQDAAFVTKIDFNNSGFQPAAFNIAFNSFGTANTGNIAQDRRSLPDINATTPEYAIYLNDPLELCQTALPGDIQLSGVSRCGANEYCIGVLTSKAGLLELLLDLDGDDGVYTPGTADLIISYFIDNSETGQAVCLDWDGLDGLGNDVSIAGILDIPVVLSYQQGIYHFPVYDAEYMINGFQISAVRPAGPTPKLFYDDQLIPVASGSGEPTINLNGCDIPCHAWNNYTDPNAIGFGNLCTINSWWFSQRVLNADVLHIPAYLECTISGPDSICVDDTVFLFLSPVFIPYRDDNLDLLFTTWSGPGLVEIVDDTIAQIRLPGMYEVILGWGTEIGDTCTTSCFYNIELGEDCCTPTLLCGQLMGANFECTIDLPPPYQDLDELIAAGLIIDDEECANFLFSLDESSSGSACGDDPLVVIRTYTIWDDSNPNGIQDPAELFVECTQTFTITDSIPPILEFTGNLDGYSDGDTIVIQCYALDPNWSMPMPDPGDIISTDNCGDIQMEMNDVITNPQDCSNAGYLKFFECIWSASDDCGNDTSIRIFMKIVDTIAPQIADLDDITLLCSDVIELDTPAVSDECNCANIEVLIDTIYYKCAADFALRYTYIAKDHCGNVNQSTRRLTISDTEELRLIPADPRTEFPANSSVLDVECYNGFLPNWLVSMDKNSMAANLVCESVEIEFEMQLIESAVCFEDGYMGIYRFSWQASSECGQQSLYYFDVRLIDHTTPILMSDPPNICDGLFNPELVDVIDNCGIHEINWYKTDPKDYCDGGLTYRYYYEISDVCGNTLTFDIEVFEDDTIAPEIIPIHPELQNLSPADTISTSCQEFYNVNNAINFSKDDVSVEDGCTEDPTIIFTQELIADSDCNNGIYGMYQLKWLVMDDCGNMDSLFYYLKVTLPDYLTILKQIPDRELECHKDYQMSFLEDLCGLATTELEYLESIVDCQFQESLLVRLWDVCGNQYTDTVFINRVDNQPPVFNEFPDIVCADSPPIVTAFDSCLMEYVTVERLQLEATNCPDGNKIYTYRASDDCGNETYREVLVIAEDIDFDLQIKHPVLGMISDGGVYEVYCPFAGIAKEQIIFDQDCYTPESSVQIESQSLDCPSEGYFLSEQYDISVTGVCGNSTHIRFVLNHLDQSPPILFEPPRDETVNCTDVIMPDIEFWDACTEVQVHREQTGSLAIDGDSLYLQEWIFEDACGNSTSHGRQVTKLKPLDCSVYVPGDIHCLTPIHLMALINGGQAPYTYDWEVIQGRCKILSKGAGPDLIIALFDSVAVVSLTVIDVDGCESTCQVIVECEEKDGVAISDESRARLSNGNQVTYADESSSLTIFPNPVLDELTVETTIEYQDPKLYVYDIYGQVTINAKLNSENKWKLYVTDLPAGVYLLLLKDSNQFEITRFVK